MTELDVGVKAGGCGAPRIDARTVQILLHQQLRRVVTDLRAHDGERVFIRRVARVDELPVGLVRRTRESLVQQLRADRAIVWDRLRVGGVGDFPASGRRAPRPKSGGSFEFFADVDERERAWIG